MNMFNEKELEEFCQLAPSISYEDIKKLDRITLRDVISSIAIIKLLIKGVAVDEVRIRSCNVGELGIIAHRHCVLYKNEYGFDDTFEGYLLEGMSKYIWEYGKKGNVWVADYWGNIMGAIAIVKTSDILAQLRWFYLEPSCRGIGLGRSLIETALQYCKEQKMERVFLWTVRGLEAARYLYQKHGFLLTETKEHFLWGRDIVEERWDLELCKNEK